VATTLGSDWAFVPGSRSYLPLASDRSGEDYVGILYGDVSGNWSPSGTKRAESSAETDEPAAKAAQITPLAPTEIVRTGPAVISLRGWGGIQEPGETRTLLVSLQRADGIVALDLDLDYDSSELSIVDVRAVGLASSLLLASHDLGGSLRIAMYGTQPLRGSGEILAITVEARGHLGGRPPLRIKALANEGAIPVRPLPALRVGR